jgi:outer membrane protein OmpA-like peptidoglycan-associated protein
MLRKATSLLALLALAISGLVATPTAASAAGGSADATLSNLAVRTNTGNGWYLTEGTRMSPAFSAAQTYYNAYSAFTAIDFTATPTDSAATVKITGGDVTDATMADGVANTLNFEAKAENLVTVTVTAADGVTTKSYKVNMSNVVMPQPKLVYLDKTKFSTSGGDYGVAYIKNMFREGGCSSNVRYQYKYVDENGNDQTDSIYMSNSVSSPDANGVSTVELQGEGLYDVFRDENIRADLRIESYCSISDPQTGEWRGATSLTIEPNAISFFNPSVTSVTMPDTISQYSVVKVFGPGMNYQGYFDSYLLNPATGNKLYFDDRRINNDAMLLYLGAWNRDQEWLTAKNVKFVVEQYLYSDDDRVATLYTKDVKYAPLVPTRVSMSPAKGSVLGGNTVKMTGHFICSGNWGFTPVITIGGRPATNVGSTSCGSENSSTGDQYDGLDQLSFTAPSGAAGNADVTLDIGFGPYKISQKYAYGDKPTVSSIVPSTVAKTGGSMVTINGTNFGLSGTPIVTIDGQKSPYVVRVSASQLLAMVPASATTGSVEVNVISSSGGGAMDLPASMSLAAASSNPTVTAVTPAKASISGGDVVTITGTGFSTTATGVTFGGSPAKITAVTATSISVEVPSADAAGSVALVVGTPTGLVTKSAFFSYTTPPGVQTVSPATVASYLTGNAAKVTITGTGFGAKGTITVGSAKPIAYTSSGSGTRISDIAIPTTKTGTISISILPTGAKVAFTTSVRVTGPVITYVGPNPYNSDFADYNSYTDNGGSLTASSTPAGGQVLRIQGTGFGTAGKIKFGSTLVTPSSYTDTAIVFTTPAATGTSVDIQVIPNTGTLTATRKAGVLIGSILTGPEITKIESSVDNARGGDRHTFSPADDVSDVFVITGSGFLSTDNGVKTVVEMVTEYGDNWVTITPMTTTNTQITFRAPRTLQVPKWAEVRVVTKSDSISRRLGIYYVGVAPQPTTMSPRAGICTKETQGTYSPAVVTANGVGVFGSAGTVKLGGETISSSAVTWSDDEVVIDFSAQTANISNPWGGKEISFIPADSTKPVLNFGFNCGVSTDVTTKLNNSTAALTVAAGTSYNATATMNNPVPGTTYVQPADGYLYQSVDDYNADAMRRNVKSGLPVAAGDWYVWANTGTATFDREKYGFVGNQNQVRLTITGTPVTFTPKLVTGTGNSIVYRGQLGDGTNGSPNDIGYTKSTTADAVTEVTWQYRNHACAVQDPNTGWNNGLPNEVAIRWSWCGGDDSAVTSWEIRVSSFKMVSGNVDKAIYYLPTYDVFELTVNKKDLTINSVKAEKVYDGNTSIAFGELTVTGAIPTDNVNLDWGFMNGAAFADATVGASKAITTNGPALLDWGWRNRYNLTNPNIQLTGTIKKADAIVKLTSNPGSVVMGNNTPVALTVETLDSRNSQAINVAAGAATPVLVNKTTSVCSLNGTNVTALKAGDCIIEATQAASTNYTAAKSFKDDSTTIEELVIKVYSAPKVVSVIADDLVVPTGDPVIPSYSMAGLIDGDAYENVEYDYYQGTTLLTSAPTAVGTYKIVPKLGSLVALDSAAYNNVIKYVAGKLIITALPPEIDAISPAHGPEAGGNTLVITGTGFGTVTSIKIGALTIRKPNFVVNGDGTTLSFKMPKGKGAITITLVAGANQVTTDYSYDPPVVGPVTGPIALKLTLKLEIGAEFVGQNVTIKGSGLKANSDYSLVMNAQTNVLFKAKTDANGAFSRVIRVPAKACATAGKHALTLTATSPAGTKVTDSAYFVINDECEVEAQAAKTTSKSWTLNGFLFGYNQPTLNAGGVSSLKALAVLLKGAKSVTIYGYTETDTKSQAVKRANITLAQGRTDNVAAYLKSLGIKAIFKTVAKGGVEPVSVTEQWRNRRVVITATF